MDIRKLSWIPFTYLTYKFTNLSVSTLNIKILFLLRKRRYAYKVILIGYCDRTRCAVCGAVIAARTPAAGNAPRDIWYYG